MIHVTEFSCLCEKGKRENNEDYICPASYSENERVFVLCDGMGGHGHGEVASETVCLGFYEYLKAQQPECYTEQIFKEALDFAVHELKRNNTFNDGQKLMGTTLVAIAINKNDILIGHIGDSRCYHFSSSGEKLFRTTDHSQVADAIAYGLITEDEAFNHPRKNILTRCIQPKSGHPVELTFDRLTNIHDKDMLLLCSDGINDALRDTEIADIIKCGNNNVKNVSNSLKTECDAKSKDNFSAIILSLDMGNDTSSDLQENQYPQTEETDGYSVSNNSPVTKHIESEPNIEPSDIHSENRDKRDNLTFVLIGIICIETAVIFILSVTLFFQGLTNKKDPSEFPEKQEQAEYRLFDRNEGMNDSDNNSQPVMRNNEDRPEMKSDSEYASSA